MPKETAPTITPLVAQRVGLIKQIDDLKAGLLKVDAQLIALGSGRYADAEGNTITVVAASGGSPPIISYELKHEDEETARTIAGDAFPKLFNRIVSFEPIDGFEKVVPTHLTPAKSHKLIELCFRSRGGGSGKSAYVKAK